VDFTPQVGAGAVAALFALVGIVAGIADWRHRKRRDLDRVSLLDWRTVQVFALIAAIITGALAAHL
jgi:hypothetical protein